MTLVAHRRGILVEVVMTNRDSRSLDELLAIIESLQFEECGDMRIVHAHWSGGQLTLRVQLDHGDGNRSAWQMRFADVFEHSLTEVANCGLNIWHDHVVIDQFIRPRLFLHFGAAAANADELVGQLWSAHTALVDDWIPFDRYLNQEVPIHGLLRSGSGVLATGPDFLISAYAEVLDRNHCLPSQVVLNEGRHLQSATMTHFGESYVVAQNLLVRRLAA